MHRSHFRRPWAPRNWIRSYCQNRAFSASCLLTLFIWTSSTPGVARIQTAPQSIDCTRHFKSSILSISSYPWFRFPLRPFASQPRQYSRYVERLQQVLEVRLYSILGYVHMFQYVGRTSVASLAKLVARNGHTDGLSHPSNAIY